MRGSLWIAIKPKNGSSSPRIRKIAAETDSAQTTSEAKVTGLGGAISEKPANKIVIQSSSTTKKGKGIELPRCENKRSRASASSKATSVIRGLKPR